MAEKIYLADKETLDNVKQDTQYIRSQFPLQTIGGTDWSKYETLNIVLNTTKEENLDKWETITSIKGKGYIKFLDANPITSSSNICINKLKLTVDGKVLYELEGKGERCHLILMPFRYKNDNEKLQEYFEDNDSNKYMFEKIIEPIFFNSEVLLEQFVKREGRGADRSMKPIQILGGIEK